MKKINAEILEQCDIILSTTPSGISKAIRITTGSDISHAMLYTKAYSVIHATADGVHSENPQRLLYEDDAAIYVLRYRDELSNEQKDTICTFANSIVGTEYSTREAIGCKMPFLTNRTNKQFCSRLVAQAYFIAGIQLVDDPSYCTPEEIKQSPRLIRITPAAIPATEADIEFSNTPSPIDIKNSCTNMFLDTVRTINPSIQTINDALNHLQDNPHDDLFFCESLQNSGYLDLWKIDIKKNPWRYTENMLSNEQIKLEQVQIFCKVTIDNAETEIAHRTKNINEYQHRLLTHDLEFIKELFKLEKHILKLALRRIDFAKKNIILDK